MLSNGRDRSIKTDQCVGCFLFCFSFFLRLRLGDSSLFPLVLATMTNQFVGFKGKYEMIVFLHQKINIHKNILLVWWQYFPILLYIQYFYVTYNSIYLVNICLENVQASWLASFM